jgi:hypothetical protein
MAYFLTCVHPFHYHKLGRVITRGEQVRDKMTIAHIYHLDNREHHFVKSYDKGPGVEYWSWPPPHPDSLKASVPVEEVE